MTILYDVNRIPPITLATRLRLAREWRGIEQQDIADELGISRGSVSNYENGRTSPGKLVINGWAATCDVDVEWLKHGGAPTDDGTPLESHLRESNPRPIHYMRQASSARKVA